MAASFQRLSRFQRYINNIIELSLTAAHAAVEANITQITVLDKTTIRSRSRS